MPFRIPTRTLIGPGTLARLPEVLGSYDAGEALVVTDAGLTATGIPDRVCGLAETAGFRPFVMDRVEVNPRTETVDAIAREARARRVQVVIGVGGGSALDAAKGVALMLDNPGSVTDYEGRNRFPNGSAPLVAIPTTCGTGSEVTWVSVLTSEKERRKISVKGERMFPEWALVDAALLKSLPPHLVASTALDAATHAIEAVISRQANPASNALAASALRRIVAHLQAAVLGREPDALAGLMEASTLAGMAFGNADVGAVHCLSESIGGRHDLPHGLLNAVLLVPVLRFHGPAAEVALAWLAREVGVDSIPESMQRLCRDVSLPSFAELEVPESDFEAIAGEAQSNGSNASNPRLMTAGDYLSILRSLR